MNTENELQNKDITYLQKEFDRLENTMTVGFAKLEARIEILSNNYMTRDEIENKLDKKADKEGSWAESILTRLGILVVSAVVVALLGLVLTK